MISLLGRIFDDVLKFIQKKNSQNIERRQSSLLINVELKGRDLAQAVYAALEPYFRSGAFHRNDFLFNSSNFNDLKNLKEFDKNLRVCPNLSKNTFSEIFNNLGNSTGLNQISSSIQTLPTLEGGLALKDIYAIDLKVTDVSQEIISFCRANGYGLMACERQGMTSDQLKAGISSLYSAARDLPIVVFKANNVSVARALLSEHVASSYSMINLSLTPNHP